MSLRHRRGIFLGLALLASVSASAAQKHAVLALDGDVPLVHVPAEPGSSISSFRFIVRAGGFQDPPGKEGLAHLLEHLIFHGSYEMPGGELWRTMRARGAVVNAFTSTSATVYTLDAPHDAFLPLMEQYTALITNPALRLAQVERERDVVAVEQRERNLVSLLEIMDAHVFQDRVGELLIGTRDTRATITLEDIIAFYQRYYSSSNVSVVVVSRASGDDVRAALNRSFLLPPEPPRAPETMDAEPLLPLDQKTRSWVTATLFGYRMPDGEIEACEDIAALLDHRVHRRLVMEDPVASFTHVLCRRTRGRTFLLAVAFTANLLGSNIPVDAEEIFRHAARKPPSEAELRVIRARNASELAALRRHSDALATVLALRVAETPGPPDAAASQVLRPPALNWERMRAVMQQAFQAQNRVVLHYSPFEG
ncbi:MAG: insulinase family protein [Myxococcota bacterium]